jgi:TPR repeat protein/S1-C subfamily serine protease
MSGIRRTVLASLLLAGFALPAGADYDSGYQAYENGNYVKALKELLPLAKQGDAKAERILGEMYAGGNGVDRDYAAAADWYRRSAGQNYGPAMADLGDLYFYGRGMLEQPKIALGWYRRGAELGDPAAEYDYALMFHDGSAGVKQDFATAMSWFLRAAGQGDAPALNMVGYMHDIGEGVPESPQEAVRWYRKAADKGFDVAEYNLGIMYQNGRGVEKSMAEAARWYRKGADQDDADSEAALGYFYERGYGVDKDLTRAISWYRSAARQGSSRALNNLGVLYDDGTGLPKDAIRAYVLYSLAASKADNDDDRKLAENNRNDIAKELSASDLARAKDLRAQAADDIDLVLPVAANAEADDDDNRRQPGWPQGAATVPEKAPDKAPDKAPTVPPLPSGGGLVSSVKAALAALGYDPGSRDKTLSDKTVAAIKAFQKDRGLPVTGQISGDLLAALLASHFEVSSTSKQVDGGGGHGLKLFATGSGFYVSPGDIVTNQHVVDGCREMRLADGSVVPVATVDKANDLALLKAPRPAAGVARFRDGHGVRTGEAILIAGFPLHNEISSEINVTTGNVSALAGPDNDRTLIQITAPVQHGNSGGPVLDTAGNVVGVVQSKFDPTAQADDDNTIDVPQNVNFAVSANTLRAFLDAEDIDYQTAPSKDAVSSTEIAERARSFTVSLECWQ